MARRITAVSALRSVPRDQTVVILVVRSFMERYETETVRPAVQ